MTIFRHSAIALICASIFTLMPLTAANADFSLRPCKASENCQSVRIDYNSTVATDRPYLQFRSGFWVNLHHYLYLQAVLSTASAHKGPAEIAAKNASAVPTMSKEQTSVWEKAVSYYAQHLTRRSFLKDGLMLANYALSKAGNNPSLAGTGLPPRFIALLKSAAPIYRKLWWKQQNRLNRKWIARATGLLQQYNYLLPRLSNIYRMNWPKSEVPVEVVLYANFGGGYTLIHPTLITISSVDPGNQRYAALEVLLHEASHGMVDVLQKELYADLRADDKRPTFQLVHVIIFYTAGELTLESLKKKGIRGYIPYAIKHGLYRRVPHWEHYYEICKKDWQPYLEGNIGFRTALLRIAHDD